MRGTPAQGKAQVRGSGGCTLPWLHERMEILVVEDDRSIAEPLVAGLVRHGFTVTHQTHAVGAAEAARNADVVLLDLGLPDGDGIDVLREIRRTSDVPVIIATARGDEADRVVGLELGADDYVVKPYSIRELAARIRAISRRRRVDPAVDTGRLQINRSHRTVTLDGSPIDLTAKEFDLLAVLAEEPGRVVPRQELFSRVWDPVWVGTGKTLDVHVASVRRKLGDADLIETVRGVGYRLHRSLQ